MTGTDAFERAVAEAAEHLGPERVRTLADGLDRGLPDAALRAALPVPGYPECVRAVREAQLVAGLPDVAAAPYLRGVADGYARHAGSVRVESVWTGPSTHTVPVRSTAQALIELAGESQRELLLMTYSARPHPPLLEALAAARERGVRISVVVETLQGAGGALSGTEPAAAFRDVRGVELWHWPTAARTDAAAKMHAKLAVADRHGLLVSSANLTQSGVTTNIEAGVLVHGGAAPQRAAEHVAQLVADGTLLRLQPGPAT